MKGTVPFLALLALLLFSTNSLSATYYVDAATADDKGTGSVSSPKKYIQSGIALMAPGDTLLLEDGVYTGTPNTIVHGVNLEPPSGSSTVGYTAIKAKNPGKVVLDGQGLHKVISLNSRNYLHFDGIVFKNAGGAVGGELFGAMGANSAAYSHHLKVTRCGFSEVPDTTGGSGYRWNLFHLRYYEFFLVEDCYAWGNGKYRYYILDCRKGVLRRCLDRIDRSTDNDKSAYGNFASVRLYNSNEILVQNQILIDSDQSNQYLDPLSAGTPGLPAMVFSDGTDNSTLASGNKVVGAIGVNNPGAKIWFHANDPDLNTDALEHSFFWGFGEGIRNREQGVYDQMTISNTVFGNINGTYAAVYSDNGNSIKVRNSLLYKNSVGIKSAVTATGITDYNSFYSNNKDLNGPVAFGPNDTNKINPDPGLKYVTRMEPFSPLKGAGEGGNDIGHNIMYQVGTSGTVYGEAGYDTITKTPLWPWPYEDIIRDNMRSYRVTNANGTIDGSRGFCAPNQALTTYVWSFFGKTVPPFNVAANTTTATSIALTWSPNTANAKITGYKVYVGTSPGIYDVTGYAGVPGVTGGRNVDLTTSHSIAGLQPKTTYYIAVTAVDSDKGESGNAYEISATTPPGPMPPTPPAAIRGRRL